MSASFNLRFPTSQAQSRTLTGTNTYRLLELPPELCKIIESGSSSGLSLTIKGKTTDDAVLCTPTQTYSLRSISLSNTLLVVSRPTNESPFKGSRRVGMDVDEFSGSEELVVRDQISEILELVPSVPKLERLEGLLKGNEYQEDGEDAQIPTENDEDRPAKRRRYTYDEVRNLVQASDAELEQGLRQSRILQLDGALRPIPLSTLTSILFTILNVIVSQSLPHTAVPLEELVYTLQKEHDIAPELTRQVAQWFGEVNNGRWKLNVDNVVRQIGLGLLSEYKDEPVTEATFTDKWSSKVGDTFEPWVSMSLLEGNYIPAGVDGASLQYFPTLPKAPAARFTDLFLTRAKWRSDQLIPFLKDIAVDAKERDKLLMKFCRSSTDGDGTVWYSARAKY